MTEAQKKGKGLRKDSDHWNLVKEQIANKEFAIADTIPAKRILEFNETEKNWPADATIATATQYRADVGAGATADGAASASKRPGS